MSRWIALETLTRELAILKDPEGYPKCRNGLYSIRMLGSVFELSQNETVEIESMRRLRNNLVHGKEIPPEEYLQEAS